LRTLGLDMGDKRIGVAVSDPLGMLARPLLVLEHKDNESDIAEILALIKQYSVEIIIVGLPRSLNGSIGSQAVKVQDFVETLKQNTSLPVYLRDERLSTVSARRMLSEGGAKKSKTKKAEYDAAAAAIILQGYLDELKFLSPPSEG
jgi:putative holliday junction resolvase